MKVTGKKTEKKVPSKGRALARQKTPEGWELLPLGTIIRKGDKSLIDGVGYSFLPCVIGEKLRVPGIRRIKAKAPARKASRKGAK